MINKTDKLDARGMNRLQRNQTLPTVWIPAGELRDQRELPRTRMMLSRERTRIKNRLHATLAKYALTVKGVSEIFGVRSRPLLEGQIAQLPVHTRYSAERPLEGLDGVEEQIAGFEGRMREVFRKMPELKLVMSLPGVAFVLGTVILLEVGDVGWFPTASHLASYAGTTPRVHSGGEKRRYGQVRSDVNRYLKWAFVEAANVISLHRGHGPKRHVSRLYERIESRKGHQKAIGAVARHLAEATWWILHQRETYREPACADPGKGARQAVSSQEG